MTNKTEHVFEGKPDERQGDGETVTSRFRPKYRALTPEEKALHDAIKEKAAEMETLYNQVKHPRYRALAFTELEASVSWIIKGLTT